MEPTEHNRRAWDEIHRRRTDVIAGQLGIPAVVRERLPDVEGKHVLHLQCATGESTKELTELGALVTGVDSSSEALAIARERVPTAAFIQADVEELPIQLRRPRFDLVYTGGAITTWLHSLDGWLQGIEAALRPGGRFLLHDGHPVAPCVDAFMHWREDYFADSTKESVGWDQFRTTGEPPLEERYERHWTLGAIVTAVAAAGLIVRRLEELPAERGWRHHDPRVPGAVLLVADKTR